MTWRWLAGVVAVCCLAVSLSTSGAAAPSGETKAFGSASKAFQDRFFANAERGFAAFLERYPESTRRWDAVLLQAQSRYYQTNLPGAAELLQRHLPEAGALRDQFHFWLGEVLFQQGAFPAAAAEYGKLLQGFKDSPLRLEAAYKEAFSLSKAGRWEDVVARLRGPGGDFTAEAARHPGSDTVSLGRLLLAEALLRARAYAESAAVLRGLAAERLGRDLPWRVQYLRVRVELESGNLPGALGATTNALAVAGGESTPQAAQVRVLQGEILERLGRLPEAVASYEAILGGPAEMRRHALLKIIELTRAQKKVPEAIALLEKFVEANPRDDAVDLASLTLGELRLGQFLQAGSQPGAVSTLDLALTNLTRVVVEFPKSPLLGRAYLYQGWSLWLKEDHRAAVVAFREAAGRLPASEDQAVARFKLGDSLLRLGDYRGAAAAFQALLSDYSAVERVKAGLLDHALYQLIRADIGLGDEAGAEAAARKILEWFPESYFSDRGALLVGQELIRAGEASQARALFSELLRRFPESKLKPELDLAVARTLGQDKEWARAAQAYREWMERHGGNGLEPQAEFSRALALWHAGEETNAFRLMTNFVARHDLHELAPQARLWLGDYYFSRGEEGLLMAEKYYQELYQKNHVSFDLECEARLNAGRAAFRRQGFKEARDYLTDLVNRLTLTNGSPAMLNRAYLGLGDALWGQYFQAPDKFAEEFDFAITAFMKVVNATNSPLAARAWGRVGDCHFQRAARANPEDRAGYARAADAYRHAVAESENDPAVWSEAHVGLGAVLEKMGRVEEALDAYLDVLIGAEGDDFHPRWVREAAFAAARLAEARGWQAQTINIYRRLGKLFPSLEAQVGRKIAALEKAVPPVRPAGE